jgi:hypothetical protein
VSGRTTVSQLFSSSQFHVGITAGLLASVAGRAVDALLGLRRRLQPVGGLLLGAALATAVGISVGIPGVVAVDLAILTVAAGTAELLGTGVLSMVAIAVVPAIVLTNQVPVHGTLPRLAVASMVVVRGPLVGEAGERWPDAGLPFAGIAISTGGIWACVPDTEAARAALGAALAGAFIAFPGGRLRVGRAGGLLVCASLAWVVGAGAHGRPASAIGAAACLGLLVAGPLGAIIGRIWGASAESLSIPAAVIGHLIVVGVASRWAGLLHSSRRAAVIATADLAIATAAVAFAIWWQWTESQ